MISEGSKLNLTKKYLKQIIREEIEGIINEDASKAVMTRAAMKGSYFSLPAAGTTLAKNRGMGPAVAQKIGSVLRGLKNNPAFRKAAQTGAARLLGPILKRALGPVGAAWMVADLIKIGLESVEEPVTWFTGGVSKSDGTQLKKYKKTTSLKHGRLFASDWKDWPDEAQVNWCKDNYGPPEVAKGKPAEGPSCRDIMKASKQRTSKTDVDFDKAREFVQKRTSINENKMILENHRKNRKAHPVTNKEWWQDA